MSMLSKWLAVIVASMAVADAEPPACAIAAVGLKVEHGTSPFVGTGRPRLSWRVVLREPPHNAWPLAAPAANRTQGAYQLQLSTSANFPSAAPMSLWDSGRVASNDSVLIPYGGAEPLPSATPFFWRVQVWDALDAACGWSVVASFETALLTPADWSFDGTSAAWMGMPPPAQPPATNSCALFDSNPAPLFRAEFTLPMPLPSRASNLAFPAAAAAPILRARLHVSGLGYYEVTLDGRRVGQSRLDPGWTSFDKRVLYSSYDVTEWFAAGFGARMQPQRHAIGVRLGNGFWNPLPLEFWGHLNLRTQTAVVGDPMFVLQLRVVLADGTERVAVATDAAAFGSKSARWAWVGTHNSGTELNNVYLGERVDGERARVVAGFDVVGFNASADAAGDWVPAVPAVDAVKVGPLELQVAPPIVRQAPLSPARVLTPPRTWDGQSNADGAVRVLDMGRNFAGSCVVDMPASERAYSPSPAPLQLVYGEILTADGALNPYTSVAGQVKSCPSPSQCPNRPCVAVQRDRYSPHAAGQHKTQRFEPRFSWHGFRYIEVRGWPASRVGIVNDLLAGVTCYPLRSNMSVAGAFESSSATLNAVHAMGLHTFESNFMSVQSDCPHRERFGYGGDALASAETAQSYWDMGAFYAKRLVDYCDAQRAPSGAFTETAPFVGIADSGTGAGGGPIGWQAYQPQAAAWLYKYYGDEHALRHSLNATRRFVELLARADAGVNHSIESGLGDWMSLEPKALPMTGRAWQIESYRAFANASRIVVGGDQGEADWKHYMALADELAASLNARFLDTATGTYRPENDLEAVTDAGATAGLSPALASAWEPEWLRECLARAPAPASGAGARLVHQQCVAARVGASWAGGQTAQALPLFMGLPPTQTLRNAALQVLVGNLNRTGRHLAVGMWGVKWLLMALSEAGRNDLAYDVMAQKDYPSFAYMMNNSDANATTVWESWFFSNNTFSHNHPMFASHSLWMQQSLGGIVPHPSARAFDRVLIKPRPVSVDRLQFVKASYESARGRIATSWAWSDSHHGGGGCRHGSNASANTLDFEVEIPPNVEAQVFVPSSVPTVHQVVPSQESLQHWRLAAVRGEFDAHGKHVKLVLGGGRYTFRSVLEL